MANHDVTIFSPYPFEVGQKIYIDAGKRKGDWEVAAIDDQKVTLKCPISKKTFAFNRFCYHVKDEKAIAWPRQD